MALAAGVAGCTGSPARGAEAFCAELVALEDATGHLGSLDAAGMRADQAALSRAHDAAPDDIAPSVAVIRDVIRSLADAVEASPPGETDADRERRAEKVWRDRRTELDRVAASARQVDAYARDACRRPLT